MRITKRQLRQIIKEEKQKLAEYGSMDQGDRAVGLYFDTRLQADAERALKALYDNALPAALEDVGDQLDAEELVSAGLQKLLAIVDLKHGRGPQ